jgi:prophage maintenance system killer protein
MKFLLNKKDIIAINQEFDAGNLNNEASLDFALSYAKRTENWHKALAYITRAILLDHVFEEGNKRTVALVIKVYAEHEGYKVYDDKLLLMIKELLSKNTISITKIEEKIKNVIH